MKKKSVTIIIPAFNEENAIGSTVQRIKELKHEFEIIVVNDGSTDKTGEILSKIKDIRLITNPYNLGYGASLKKGIHAAKGDWILISDSDGTYPIEDIPKLLSHVPHYDMVVGARTGKTVHIPFLRRPAKWFIGLLVNFMCKRKVEDVNSGFRVFKRELALNFMNLFPSGFSFTTTITLVALNNDYTVKYIPIDYYKRKGKSTISPIKDFVGFITLIFRIVIYFNPLRFFLIPGILLILLGLIYGIYQIITLPSGLGQFPILFIIAGIQICFLGVIADLINNK